MSTGIDTFSRATFDDVLHTADQSATAVYFIGLGDRTRSLIGTTGPLAKIDWKRAEDRLETLATVSGGRAYLKDATSDVPGIYDDMMEHLRVRYVITYSVVESRRHRRRPVCSCDARQPRDRRPSSAGRCLGEGQRGEGDRARQLHAVSVPRTRGTSRSGDSERSQSRKDCDMCRSSHVAAGLLGLAMVLACGAETTFAQTSAESTVEKIRKELLQLRPTGCSTSWPSSPTAARSR